MDQTYQQAMISQLMNANQSPQALNGQNPISSYGQNFLTNNGMANQMQGQQPQQQGMLSPPPYQQQMQQVPTIQGY